MSHEPALAPRPFHLDAPPVLEILPFGGLGEFGLNMMGYRAQGTLLLVDCGASFPDASLPGVELIIPDFEALNELSGELCALILTHGHEDHIGAIPYLLRELGTRELPIYGSRFTLELVKNKLAEHPDLHNARLTVINPQSHLDFGPFGLGFLQVNHSIPQALALVIETPLGPIVHSGDFRIDTEPAKSDSFDYAGFAALGQKGVFALLSDSTNIERPGFTKSESEVARSLSTIFENAPGRLIISLFASAIPRLAELLTLAEHHKRRVLLAGRSVINTLGIARELGLLSVPDSLFIGAGQLGEVPPEKLLIILTGSQGEPRAALSRVATGEHKEIKIQAGDTLVLSSRIIPGNERDVRNLINLVSQQGAEVISEHEQLVHTSGHAQAGELATLLSLTHPKWFIPIHGEYAQLKRHGRLAQSCGVAVEHIILATNGHVVAFSETWGGLSRKVPTGRRFIDGESLLTISPDELRERRKIGELGLVIAVIVISRESGKLLSEPQFVTRGLVYDLPQGRLLEDASACLLDVWDDLSRTTRNDPEALKEEIRRATRRYFGRVVGRKPVVIPIVLRV